MTFTDAVVEMLDGQMVRRPIWRKGEYSIGLCDLGFYDNDGHNLSCSPFRLNPAEIKAKDWEIAE